MDSWRSAVNGRSQIRVAVLAALMGLAGAPAIADEAALAEEVAALRAALEEQRAQLAAQAKLLETQQAQLESLARELAQSAPASPATPATPAGPAPAAPAAETPRVAFSNSRLTVTAADGRSSLAVRGFAQMDGAMYREDSAGPLATDFRRGSVGAAGNRDTTAARDFSEGFLLRRARMGVDGTVGRNFTYRLLFDFGGSGTEGPARVNDAWIGYTGLAPFTFQLGAFSPPANMDDSTSAEDLVFLERSSAGEISRALAAADARFGLGVKAGGPRWMGALTLTSRTIGEAEAFDSQLAAVARVGFLVATGDDYNVHVGASGTYVFAPPDQGPGAAPRHPLRFRDRPEIRVDGTRLIDTGGIDADHASVFAGEFGANWRNLYVQGEHFWFDVARRAPTTLPDPAFAGYYMQGSWILTGESRRYNAAAGSFQNPRPRAPFTREGGAGAWELAARYSRMNLDFEAGPEGSAALPGSVRGGAQSIVTLGVNWYPNANFRLMVNYIMIDVDRSNPAGPGNLTPFGPVPSTPPDGVDIGQDLDVLAIRSQYSF
jgi:phosphate-selective porin OprO/OprP